MTVTTPSSSDIGHVLQKVLTGIKITSDDIRNCLQARWTPTSREELPFSFRGGIRRYLGLHYLTSFPWLAISRVEDLKGAWCVWCSLFSVRRTAGGHNNSGGQMMGALVQRPLMKFDNLTGKLGDLSVHNKAAYHLRCQEQAT
jgi:hypothetical protein